MNRIGQQRARPASKTRSGIKNYIGKWKDERTSLGGRAASSGEIVRVKTICASSILLSKAALDIISLDRRQAAVDGGRTGERLEAALRAPAPLASLGDRDEGVGEAPVH